MQLLQLSINVLINANVGFGLLKVQQRLAAFLKACSV